MKQAQESPLQNPLPSHSAPQPYLLRTRDVARSVAAGDPQSDPAAGARQKIARDAHVFREGDGAKKMYRLLDGSVMLYKILADGRRQVVEFVTPGGVFGVSPCGIYECSAEALADSEVAAFDRRAVECSPLLLRLFSGQMQVQLCAMHDQAMLLGRKSALERVASFLLQHVPGRGGYACTGRPAGEDCATVHLDMTRQEIADYLGLTIETVSRVLSQLRRRGLLRIERLDEVRINDVCGVCRLTGTH